MRKAFTLNKPALGISRRHGFDTDPPIIVPIKCSYTGAKRALLSRSPIGTDGEPCQKKMALVWYIAKQGSRLGPMSHGTCA